MLKIANWYESSLGRNDGNPLFVTAFLKRAQRYCNELLKKAVDPKFFYSFTKDSPEDFRAREFAQWFLENIDPDGFDIQHLRPWGDLETFGEFDLNIWVDWGEDGLTGVLGYDPIFPPGKPLVYWASDTHLGFDYRLSRAKESDLVFCAQKRGLEDMQAAGLDKPSYWLPHAVEPLAYPKFNLASKKYDIGFVGHINSENRLDALDRMFKEFPNFFFGRALFEEAARKYAESKIVFNISHVDDINMRCFEVMATGSFLLTNELPTLPLLFETGKHLVTYSSVDVAIEKAEYFLKNFSLREEIANTGCTEVLKNHTFYNRVKFMFENVKEHNLIGVRV